MLQPQKTVGFSNFTLRRSVTTKNWNDRCSLAPWAISLIESLSSLRHISVDRSPWNCGEIRIGFLSTIAAPELPRIFFDHLTNWTSRLIILSENVLVTSNFSSRVSSVRAFFALFVRQKWDPFYFKRHITAELDKLSTPCWFSKHWLLYQVSHPRRP